MIDWGAVGDLVCQILVAVRDQSARFEAEARARGISLEQLTAAAITEAVREQVEGRRSEPGGRR
jgi:hypothetical protein